MMLRSEVGTALRVTTLARSIPLAWAVEHHGDVEQWR